MRVICHPAQDKASFVKEKTDGSIRGPSHLPMPSSAYEIRLLKDSIGQKRTIIYIASVIGQASEIRCC